MQTNPDTRPLPPGWHQHFDPVRQSWHYVQINVLPPKVSYTHPASLTLDPSRGGTLPVLLEKPSAPQTEAPSASVTSSIQSRALAGSRLSAAQQLYASAINKRKSSSQGPEASHGPKSPPKSPLMSPPPVPLAPKHASSSAISSPVFSFPDLSRGNAQQAGPTDLYNLTVVAQRGGGTSSSRRANQDSVQPRSSPPPPRSQSVQFSSLPHDPTQPNRASTLASVQLDYLNRQNRNVVITRSTRVGEAPTIAMTVSPPSAEQKSHSDMLISPPLYASSGPPPSAHYNAPVTFPPPTSSLLTGPISPPTYYQSGRNQQSLSHTQPTYHPAPDQTRQKQYSATQVTQNQPPIQLSSTALPSATPTPQTQTRSQALPSQYQYQSQQMPPQNSIQRQVPPSAQQQGIIPDSRGHALPYSQPPHQTQPEPQGITLQQHNQPSDQAQIGPQGYVPQYSQPPNQVQPGPQGHMPRHIQPPHQAQPTGPQGHMPRHIQPPRQAQPTGPQGHTLQPPNHAQPGLQGHTPQYIQPLNQVQPGMQGHAPQYAQPPHQTQPALQGYASQHTQPPHQARPGLAPQYTQPRSQEQSDLQGYTPQHTQPPNEVQAGAPGYTPQYSQTPNQVQGGMQPQYTSQILNEAQAGMQLQYSQTLNQVQGGMQPQYTSQILNQAQAGIQLQYSQTPNQAHMQPQYTSQTPDQIQAGVQPQYTSQTPNQALAGVQPQYSNQTPNQTQAGIQPQYSQASDQAQAGVQPQYSQTPIQGQTHLADPPPMMQNQAPPRPPQQLSAQISYGSTPQRNSPQHQAGRQPAQQMPLQRAHNQVPTSAHQPIGGPAQYQGYTQQPQYHPTNQYGSTIPQQQPLYQVQPAPGFQPPPQHSLYNQQGPIQAAYSTHGGLANPGGNMYAGPTNSALGHNQQKLQAPGALEQSREQVLLGSLDGLTGVQGQHHGSAHRHESAQGRDSSYIGDYGEVLTDAGVLPVYVAFDETQVTVVDTWSGDVDFIV